MTGWHDFLAAEVQTTSALAGLLFVALSINIAQIMKRPPLPRVGAQALALLIASQLEVTFGLIPQPTRAMGVELSATAAVAWVLLNLDTMRMLAIAKDHRAELLMRVVEMQIATVPQVISGGSLLFGAPGALYWLAGGVLATIALAAYNAWVLLVEILR